MSLNIDQITKLRQLARKEKDAITYNLCTLIVGEYQTRLKGPKPETANVESIVRKFLKDNKSVLALKEDENLVKENAFLQKLLPKQLTEDQIYEIMSQNGVTNVGQGMKILKAQFEGLYDGKTASSVIKNFLES